MIGEIFDHAIKGLEKLQNTYPNSNTSEAVKNWINLLNGHVETPPNLTISPISKQVKEGWRLDYLKDFAKWFKEASDLYDQRSTSPEASRKLQYTLEKIKTLTVLKQIEFEEILHMNKNL